MSKQRRGFVTNSSSSSFIFGKPGELIDKSLYEEYILKAAEIIHMATLETLDFICRYTEVLEDGLRSKYGISLYSLWSFIKQNEDLTVEISDRYDINKLKSYQHEWYSLVNKSSYIRKINIYHLISYIEYSLLNNIKNIDDFKRMVEEIREKQIPTDVKSIMMDFDTFYDFTKPFENENVCTWDINELLEWYDIYEESEDYFDNRQTLLGESIELGEEASNNDKKALIEKYRQIAYSKLGQYVYYAGSEFSHYTYLIWKYLEKYCPYYICGCSHMG